MAVTINLTDLADLQNEPTAIATINANNAVLEGIASDILSRSGTTPNSMQSALDMNSNQIYNLPEPSSMTSPARLQDVISGPTITVPGTGTSGHVVGYLDTNNTYSGNNTFNGTSSFNGGVALQGIGVSGNITSTGGANSFTGTTTFAQPLVLPANSIANASLGTMASNTVKGSIAGGTPADLTATQLTTIPNTFTSSLKGLVPASGGGTTTFLRADGSWARSGSYSLLGTYTASSSSALGDFTVFTSDYNSYEIVFDSLVPSVNGAVPAFQIYSTSLRNTGYLNALWGQVGNTYVNGVLPTSYIPMAYNTSVDTTNNPKNATTGISGRWRVSNPSDASSIHLINGQVGYQQATGTGNAIFLTSGYWNTAAAITGFSFFFVTGTITSGSIKIYGLI